MRDKNYNWWADPKNKEAVDKMSWWEHEENKTVAEIPMSIICTENKDWVAATNDDTKNILGEDFGITAQGKTKEDAKKKFLLMIKWTHEYSEECRRNYQRFVPFRKGRWKHSGGKWVAIFGIHFYFRYGEQNNHGFFIPFTKLNISISNDWKQYNKWKNRNTH